MSSGQEAVATATDELRTSVRAWVETMQMIQQEESDWLRDKEVLENYKEGLEKEIADLREQLAAAQVRKDGADKESLEKVAERDRYATAKEQLTGVVRDLEQRLAGQLVSLPVPLLKEPRMAQLVEELERGLELPSERLGEGVSKRLLNLITLVTEAEKFQHTVHLRSELHRDGQGREYNMKVIYFGLATAYAVNEDDTFALVGLPSVDGWNFQERSDLASLIRQLIAATVGDRDAAFVTLPLLKP